MEEIIRTIQPGDNPVIAKIIRDTLVEYRVNKPGTVFADEETDHLFEHFQQPRSFYYVVELDNNIIGGAGIYPLKDGPSAIAELQKMYLLPQARGRGIGKRLMRLCLDFAASQHYRQCYIETMPELKEAIRLYEKTGFNYLSQPKGNTGHCDCHTWMIKDL